MGSETHPSKILDQLAGMQDGIMQSDAAWCRGRIKSARQLLKQGKPANKSIQAVIDRVAASAERCRLRKENVLRPEYDSVLPIVDRRQDIIDAIRGHQVLVIAGETGSGKTTQIPKMCLEAERGIRGLIGCTQPRRIAAQAMADRVAEELKTPLGDKVGYQVRFREKLNRNGYIKFMTDGILLAETTHDRNLDAYDKSGYSLTINSMMAFVLKELHRTREAEEYLREIIENERRKNGDCFKVTFAEIIW